MGYVNTKGVVALRGGEFKLILCAQCNKGITVAYNELCFVCYRKNGRKFTRHAPRNGSWPRSHHTDRSMSKLRRFSS
jgi:hypothetical protein